VLELAGKFTKSGIRLDLTNTRKNSCALDEQFDLKVKNVKQGLYVCIFVNDSKEFAVRDNNSSQNEKGNVVIQKQGASVKFGKFEIPGGIGGYIPSGIVNRMRTNYLHLHTTGSTPEKVFNKTLKDLFVFDLTGKKLNISGLTLANTPSALEKMWNMAVTEYITKEEYCTGTQRRRSEWRYVRPDVANDSAAITALKGYLEELEKCLLTLCS
jgi:hypothetical protein